MATGPTHHLLVAKNLIFIRRTEYVYQFSPLNRDVFQIGSSGKQLPHADGNARLGIGVRQVAPVSKSELDSYKILLRWSTK